MINGQNIIFNFKFFYWAYWERNTFKNLPNYAQFYCNISNFIYHKRIEKNSTEQKTGTITGTILKYESVS